MAGGTRQKVKNILFTFDYELFLGTKSGTARNCIIEPTNRILKVLSKHGIEKSLFFVDTVYLMRLEEVDDEYAKEDFSLITDQLIDIVKRGHYIFPHIHPHWLDADYHKFARQWGLKNSERYRFHNISASERAVLFEVSINFIRNIQQKAGVSHNIDSYRAGGWCIQPFSDFKPYFEKHDIKFDFSVIKDFKLSSEKFYYDFKDFPGPAIYRFEDKINKATEDGSFTEFSVTHISLSKFQKFVDRFYSKILYELNYLNFGDGQAIRKIEDNILADESPEETNIHAMEITSLDALIFTKMQNYKNYSKKNEYVHFVSHPKMLSRHNIYCFDRYLDFMTKNFILETDYKKMVRSQTLAPAD